MKATLMGHATGDHIVKAIAAPVPLDLVVHGGRNEEQIKRRLLRLFQEVI